jgi:hypothetical protein
MQAPSAHVYHGRARTNQKSTRETQFDEIIASSGYRCADAEVLDYRATVRKVNSWRLVNYLKSCQKVEASWSLWQQKDYSPVSLSKGGSHLHEPVDR